MIDTATIREHMEVVGSDGMHVGTVDKVENEMIKLTRNDAEAGGQHHTLPTSLVASVDASVRLSLPAAQAKQQWQTAP